MPFSTPLRRLGDKTQVFPLEKNDSVRTRLTHSHEVSNLARSIGVPMAEFICPEGRYARDIPATLAAIGLAHDLGNPPFGHQGENAIGSWFKRNEKRLFDPEVAPTFASANQCETVGDDLHNLTDEHKLEFLNFEANAQTLRVVTRLQVVRNDLGLNLTFGTLAALMKYTVSADETAKNGLPSQKKFGFFASEKGIVNDIWNATGLEKRLRHPLTSVMEACDDWAYSVIDAEDTVKKQLVSFYDLIAWLENFEGAREDCLCKWVRDRSLDDHKRHNQGGLSPAEVNDVSMQKFRVHAIRGMVSAVIQASKDNYDSIMNGDLQTTLIDASMAAKLCKALKRFDREHAYRHRGVLEIELSGYNVIHERSDYRCLDSRVTERANPFAAYAYGRISENYRRIFEGKVESARVEGSTLPIRYRGRSF
jgi:dGTPase